MPKTIQEKISLAPYTTLQVGGEAQYFSTVHTEEELEEVVKYAQERRLPITILGGGSNILVADTGVSGLVLHLQLKGITYEKVDDTVLVTAAAGEVFDSVVQQTVAQEYWGLENLSHIPGSVGATPVQNVGAYGVEVKDLIREVRVYNLQTQNFEKLKNTDCAFGYRDSIFKTQEGKKYIVVSVTYCVHTLPRPVLSYKDLRIKFSQEELPCVQAVRDAIIKIRASKFPDWNTVGTAGSFFKNPIVTKSKYDELCIQYPELPGFETSGNNMKLPLGWILDKILGLKGEGTDRVGTYKEQALVIINKGQATAEDIKYFAESIIQKVFDTTGISVEWEVTKIE